MKIALAQLNYHIANFEDNVAKIISTIETMKQQGAELVVFSELSVCGYPPRDFLEQKEFIEACESSINKIATHCRDIAAIIGAPMINPNPKGKKLFNSAIFLSNGKVLYVQHKTLLPTYDIFDEYRYFEPNTEFDVVFYKGKKIALTVCEDLWDNQPVENSFAKNKLYTVSPMRKLLQQSPDIIINIAASPFSYTHDMAREEVLIENAVNYRLPIIYVNQTGANTDLIFDGGSMFINNKGQVIGKLKFFDEEIRIFDIDAHEVPDSPPIQPTYIEQIHDALVLGIKDFFLKSNLKTATLGLSGGIDSAVTLALAVKALGSENIRVLLLPSQFSSDHSINDARVLADRLNIKYDIVNIQQAVDSVISGLNPIFGDLPFNIAEENIQARLRGVYLMAISNKFGNLLLNTSNKSEAAVGYGTLYGDMNGAISVLGDVYKRDVYNLAHFINRDTEIIPINTITKPPSAELAPGQKDSDSLPDYEILDEILFRYIEQKHGENDLVAAGYDRNLVRRVISLVNKNEFKRFQAPPILRVSNKAFGTGRRMPLIAKYIW